MGGGQTVNHVRQRWQQNVEVLVHVHQAEDLLRRPAPSARHIMWKALPQRSIAEASPARCENGAFAVLPHMVSEDYILGTVEVELLDDEAAEAKFQNMGDMPADEASQRPEPGGSPPAVDDALAERRGGGDAAAHDLAEGGLVVRRREDAVGQPRLRHDHALHDPQRHDPPCNRVARV